MGAILTSVLLLQVSLAQQHQSDFERQDSDLASSLAAMKQRSVNDFHEI